MEEELNADETKKEDQQKETRTDEKSLDKMTAPELREIAKEIPGVAGVHAMKKGELLTTIKNYRGIKEEEPSKKTKKGPKPSFSAAELKGKLSNLRQEKVKAQEAKDKKQVDTLRRRINRLKKLTRKVPKA
jgi:cell division protein FtsX